ncbi:MAG: WD40 repeat domain-containing protein [Candidatus Competibacteraceae bacterium]
MGEDPNMDYADRNTAEQALRWALAAAGSRFMSGHDASVYRLVASPDGHWLASVSGDRSVRLWDLHSNPPKQCRVLMGHRNFVTGAAFSPDGRWLATAGRDGKVGLWKLDRPYGDDPEANPETESQEPLTVHTPNFNEAFTAIAFSPAREGISHLLAVGSDKGVLRLWDMTHLTAEPQTLEKRHEGAIVALEFSPDGRLLASGSQDKTVRIWDVANDAVNWHPPDFTGHPSRVTALAFSPDSHWLASADENGTIYRWNPTDVSAKSLIFTGNENPITAIAFRRDGHTLISASRDSTVRLWETAAVPPPAPPPKPRIVLHQNSLLAMVLAQDDRRLFSASLEERLIRLWELGKPTTIEPLQLWDHKELVVAVAFNPISEHLVSADRAGSALIWDLDDLFPVGSGGAESQDREAGAGPQDGSSGCAETAFKTLAVNPVISPDGRTLATAAENVAKGDIVCLWDLAHPSAQPSPLPGPSPITALAFSLDGHKVAATDKNRQVLLWNRADPTAAPSILNGHETLARALAFSPDGQTLASGDDSGHVLLWDLNNPSAEPRRFRPHSAAVTAVAFSPDGQTLASASRDKTMRLWNRDDGGEVHNFTGYKGIVMALAFSPDGKGKTLAAGSTDNTVRLWNLDHPEQDAHVLRGHRGPVLALAFSPDGRLLASGAADRAVFVWRTRFEEVRKLACRSVQRKLSPEEKEQYFKNEEYQDPCPKD